MIGNKEYNLFSTLLVFKKVEYNVNYDCYHVVIFEFMCKLNSINNQGNI